MQKENKNFSEQHVSFVSEKYFYISPAALFHNRKSGKGRKI